MTKKCLITGINGFLASYAAKRFVKEGYTIIGIHHSKSTAPNVCARSYSIHLPSPDLNHVLRRERPDVIIHAAGTASVAKSVDFPLDDFMISVPGTAGLLEGIRKESPESMLIFLSSAAVYGNPETLPIPETAPVRPVSPYGFHKRMGEELCEEYSSIFGLNTYVLRIFSAYGIGLRKQVIYELAMKMLAAESSREKLEVMGSGMESRDFIHARDVAEALFLLAEKRPEQRIYNCGSGSEITMKTLVEKMLQIGGIPVEPVFSGTLRTGDPLNWKADISSLKNLGFTPSIAFEDGLKEIFTWLRT